MPLLKPRTRGKQLVRHRTRLDRETNETLYAYAHFLGERRDVPLPSYVIHSSPGRLHALWQVERFTKEGVEALQKRLTSELGTDTAAVSCAQLTRLPGFLNHKYAPGHVVTAEYREIPSVNEPGAFGVRATLRAQKAVITTRPRHLDRARRYIAAIPPAIHGQHGDLSTFQVCCRLVRGFALTDEEALEVMREWNACCRPPWTDQELLRKFSSARRSGREPVGGLLR